MEKGSRGQEASNLQMFLGLKADGIFGPITEQAVKEWQAANGLFPAGILDAVSAGVMGYATTDGAERVERHGDLLIEKTYLPPGEYLEGVSQKQWIFLHHTAGWHNPYNTINGWANDTRGPIATEFVLGGQSARGNDNRHDGVLVQAFPQGHSGWHLGINSPMQRQSVAIELCNFGWVESSRTYAGTLVNPKQTITLAKPFRGHATWHRYSDTQIEMLRKWLLFIAERDSIDLRKGLPQLIRQHGADAFDMTDRTMCESTPGLWTHTNVRTDKTDLFPQPELMDMLTAL